MTDAVRSTHRQLTPEEQSAVQGVKLSGLAFLDVLDSLSPGRETALAKTKIEEAVMWAVKGITG